MMAMPDPFVPLEVDLSDFQFMPLDVRRLRDSRLVATSSGDEFMAWMLLLCASWHQKPAGSLPADDTELSQLAGFGRSVKEFLRVKNGALYGWTLCTDGRLYNQNLAEKVLEAWGRHEVFSGKNTNRNNRQQRWRARQKELCEQLRQAGVTPPAGASLETLERLLVDAYVDGHVDAHVDAIPPSTVDTREMPLTGTGTGTGTGTDLGLTPSVPQRRDDPVATVFTHWREVMRHPKAALDEKRRKTIRIALKGYSVEDLKKAIDGCSRTPHNMGQNDQRQRYDDLGLILRDAAHIDRFIRNADRPVLVTAGDDDPFAGNL